MKVGDDELPDQQEARRGGQQGSVLGPMFFFCLVLFCFALFFLFIYLLLLLLLFLILLFL